MTISRRQKAIIIGSVLGDGYLEYDGYRGTRLQIKQAEKRKEYVLWLYKELKEFCRTEPKQKSDNMQWYFGTRFFIELTKIRAIFYRDRKIIPDTIGKLLADPLSLAIWYMDDGTLDWRLHDHFAFSLTVNCFSVREVKKLQKTLYDNFGIIASVQNPLCRGKRYPKLYIGKNGRMRFLSLIQPYMHECFAYKLPPLTNPSET